MFQDSALNSENKEYTYSDKFSMQVLAEKKKTFLQNKSANALHLTGIHIANAL